MAQFKIYGLSTTIKPIQKKLSDVLHSCMVDSLKLPADKRFHRFFCMDEEDFIYPSDRTEKYIIIEVSMFEGRTDEVKRKLLNLIMERVHQLGIHTNDIEITIFETPKNHWGIRGVPGDELQLNYKVDV
ncbi:tautomerase family protein [Paenibacillus sp. Marseille-Q4541]|uniref:tautomerase family protein n=1 Tax=Paenibacillus sp. Marseille-Q4541 TaxID=2831522 RepID=UPI001BA8B67F|nr:tautomerase family protein [Paenibacillus sp. Marseille-Q4541]